MTEKTSLKPPERLFHELDALARPYPVIRGFLTGDCREIVGLVLLQKGLPAGAVKKTLASLNNSGWFDETAAIGAPGTSEENRSGENRTASLAGQRQFQELLSVEIDRVRKNRLPCSLLALALDGQGRGRGHKSIEQILSLVQQYVQPVDIAVALEGGIVAILLPSVNLGRAMQRAELIRQAVNNDFPGSGGKKTRFTVSIVVAVYTAIDAAVDATTADDFFCRCLRELEKIKARGSDQVRQMKMKRQADTCQVTVEERAQLFSGLYQTGK